MRASQHIVAGRFCGGEIEPGTFHRNSVQGFDGGVLSISPSHFRSAVVRSASNRPVSDQPLSRSVAVKEAPSRG